MVKLSDLYVRRFAVHMWNHLIMLSVLGEYTK